MEKIIKNTDNFKVVTKPFEIYHRNFVPGDILYLGLKRVIKISNGVNKTIYCIPKYRLFILHHAKFVNIDENNIKHLNKRIPHIPNVVINHINDFIETQTETSKEVYTS